MEDKNDMQTSETASRGDRLRFNDLKPGMVLRAIKPHRVCFGYGPNRDGLCGVGELFLVSADSDEIEAELWVLGFLLQENRKGTYGMPSRIYYDPERDGLHEFFEDTGIRAYVPKSVAAEPNELEDVETGEAKTGKEE